MGFDRILANVISIFSIRWVGVCIKIKLDAELISVIPENFGKEFINWMGAWVVGEWLDITKL